MLRKVGEMWKRWWMGAEMLPAMRRMACRCGGHRAAAAAAAAADDDDDDYGVTRECRL